VSITPTRAHANPAVTEAKPAEATRAAAAAHGGERADSSHLRAGWLPHHLKSQLHAAHWVVAMHRAMPQAAMGIRAGMLVPPRGALLNQAHARSDTGGAHRAANSPRALSARQADATTADSDVSQLAAALGQGHVPVQGRGAGGGSGGHGGQGEQGQSHQNDAIAARAAQAQDATAAQASTATDEAGQLANRLRAGEVCWVSSLQLAMACAQHHPGTDIFVQALHIVDSEGHALPAFTRRAKLRANAGETARLRPDDGAARDADAGSAAWESDIHNAGLLALSLRPVLGDNGELAHALANTAPAEWEALSALFDRPMPAGLAEALCAEAERLAWRWRCMSDRTVFDQHMAEHGDAILRALQYERAGVSHSISASDRFAAIAHANWVRAQDQVTQWAARGRWPDWSLLCRLNTLLGEGLAPWNKPEQASRVGARFGQLRKLDVVAGQPPQYFLRADQLPVAVATLFDWLSQQRRQRRPWLLIAAQMHQRLLSLHPFVDANGRTARLVQDWLLLLHGLPLPVQERRDLALLPNQALADQPAPALPEKLLLQALETSLSLYRRWLPMELLDVA
jgi:Fic/DOC family